MRHLWTFFLLLSAYFVLVSPTFGAYFYLQPSQKQVHIGKADILELWVDTEGAQVLALDAYFNYSSATLSIIGVDNPTQNTIGLVYKNKPESNTFYIGGITSDPNFRLQGKLKVADISFVPTQKGETQITYKCTTPNRTDDSNIIEDRSNPKDIIECGKNGEASLVVLEPTLTPTLTPTLPPTCPTPSTAGDIDCDGEVDLADFESWRQSFTAGKSTLKEFEFFRRAYTYAGDWPHGTATPTVSQPEE